MFFQMKLISFVLLMVYVTSNATSSAKEVPEPCNSMYNIVLLGETGVGKSTFGNYILGLDPANGFQVGGGAESVTTTTRTLVNYFLGDSSNECISVTDTPGLGDTECRDEDHMKGIIEAIMEKQHIDLFVWIFRGTDNRFDSRVQGMILMFEKVLGNAFYKNLLIEFTFFRHDPRSRLLRSMNNITMEEMSLTWNSQFKERFNLTEPVPAVFLDPLYMKEISETEEIKRQDGEIQKVKQFLQTQQKYDCEENCMERLNLWHELMKPEILTKPMRADRNSKVQLKCSIWLESKCPAKSQELDHSLQWKFYANQTETPVALNRTLFNFTLETSQDFPIETSVLTFFLVDETEGSFACNYGSDVTDQVAVSMILGPKVAGYWTDWSEWTQCIWKNGTRVQTRHRHCIPPVNRGEACHGNHLETRRCENTQEADIGKCFNVGYTWSNDRVMDIARDTVNEWSCRSACLDNPQCAGYTWFGKNSADPTFVNACKLFSSIGEEEESDGTSGTRDCSCSVPFTCGISSNNAYSPFYVRPTPTERSCMQLCADTEDCTVYTWYDSTSFARYQCYLYKKCLGSMPCNGCHTGHETCGNICIAEKIRRELNEESRNIKSSPEIKNNCDNRSVIPGNYWYKFSGLAGTEAATSPPPYQSCGTNNPIWLNGTTPMIPGSKSEMTACYVTSSSTICKKEWQRTIQARNCGDGPIYRLPSVVTCHSRYCGQ